MMYRTYYSLYHFSFYTPSFSLHFYVIRQYKFSTFYDFAYYLAILMNSIMNLLTKAFTVNMVKNEWVKLKRCGLEIIRKKRLLLKTVDLAKNSWIDSFTVRMQFVIIEKITTIRKEEEMDGPVSQPHIVPNFNILFYKEFFYTNRA